MSREGARGPSLRLRIVVGLARRYLKPRSAQPADPAASRASLERLVLPAFGAKTRVDTVGGVGGEWTAAPGRERPGRTLLYLHGGAYVTCSPRTHRPITAAFARRGFRVFAPGYRLAPEHPFPAALEDAVAAYRGLLEAGAAPGSVAVAGESAGGGLALAALVRLREIGLPPPAAAALFSPWTDLACTGDTMRSNAGRDPLFLPVQAEAIARLYLGAADARDPLASPLYAALGGLPPLLVHVGESEILRADSERVAARVAAAGGEVLLEVWPVVPHGWQILAAILPEARRSVDAAAAFLHRHIDPGVRPG